MIIKTNEERNLESSPHCFHEEEFAFLRKLYELAKFCCVGREGLFTEHMLSGEQSVSRILVMIGMRRPYESVQLMYYRFTVRAEEIHTNVDDVDILYISGQSMSLAVKTLSCDRHLPYRHTLVHNYRTLLHYADKHLSL